MSRQPTGQLYENRSRKTGKVTSYGVRFRHGGKRRYVTLDATTRREAEVAMAHLMADVQRGIWSPPEDHAPEPVGREIPIFYDFAAEWLTAQRTEGGHHGKGIAPKTDADLCWRLNGHLLPFFARHRLDAIRVEEVDRFRRAEVARGDLSPASVNKMLGTLAAILEVAVEYGLIERNPAKGKRRRLRVSRPRRTYLDRAEHVVALLDAAGGLDAARGDGHDRRALLAVLVFAGLRIGEALDLRWRDVDLAGGRIRVRGTKTAAADRTVEILPALRDDLLALAAARGDRPADARIFGTRTGEAQSQSNVRSRVLLPSIKAANAALEKAGRDPLPDGVTPHALRRTFASILVALGRDPAVVMRQMGHTTPHMTLGVYAAAMDWREGERERLLTLVSGESPPSGAYAVVRDDALPAARR